jgi:hypothetical protein
MNTVGVTSFLQLAVLFVGQSEFPVRRPAQLFPEENSEFVVFNSQRIEDREHLSVEFVLRQPDAGMIASTTCPPRWGGRIGSDIEGRSGLKLSRKPDPHLASCLHGKVSART